MSHDSVRTGSVDFIHTLDTDNYLRIPCDYVDIHDVKCDSIDTANMINCLHLNIQGWTQTVTMWTPIFVLKNVPNVCLSFTWSWTSFNRMDIMCN